MEEIKEEWRPIAGYEGLYEVSDQGRIRSLCKGKCLISPKIKFLQKHYKGHLFIYLYKEGERKKFFVHRIVAVAFIPNPYMKLLVNHIDEVKHNNAVTNLEWMTEGENIRYYWKMRGVEINPENKEF